MGNAASTSQGGSATHDKRDVGCSVSEEQHDWQPEQAVAPKPETQSLQQTRKSYSGATRGTRKSSSTEADAQLDAHSDAQPRDSKPDPTKDSDTQRRAKARKSLNAPDHRNRKSSVMKDDKTSSVIQDDSSSSTEDERDDFQEAQQRDQRSPRSHPKSPTPQTETSSSDEEQQQRRSSRRRKKTRRMQKKT